MTVVKRLLIALIVVTAMAAMVGRVEAADATANTVVWISIDGLRHDYLQRIKPPTLWRLAHEGAWTHDEIPIFPSLTFPNHIAQVTDVTVDKDGIPMNAFFDPASDQSYSFPDDSRLLRAEPIWVTARRRGTSWIFKHGFFSDELMRSAVNRGVGSWRTGLIKQNIFVGCGHRAGRHENG